MTSPCYLTDLGMVNALGGDRTAIARSLFKGVAGLAPCDWVAGRTTYTAPVSSPLAPLTEALAMFDSRNARLALAAVEQMRATLTELALRYDPTRVAVIAGTSTSGIGEGESAVAAVESGQPCPDSYHYRAQEIGNLAQIVAEYTGFKGLAYTISTACSSSAHALASAKRLLQSRQVDAVIAGGADSLCRLTVNGFASLDSVSEAPCTPFSENRAGINIGEGAAFFVVTREPLMSSVRLLGAGASSDAHHISAPEPGGRGAELAIQSALADAGLSAKDVGYINLHGTGTPLNDAMEAGVVSRLFPRHVQVSSSKGQLGHTLGAAGATEAGLMWLALTEGGKLPPHRYDGHYDPRLPELNLVATGEGLSCENRPIMLSNSFAFGGNNAALLLGAEDGQGGVGGY